MGMFRDSDCQEIDLVKEMAEALGSTGLRLEEALEKAGEARKNLDKLLSAYHGGNDSTISDVSLINKRIAEYNSLVDKAEDTRRWLLIQREAIGFRIHREVDRHYPIPARMKLLKR